MNTLPNNRGATPCPEEDPPGLAAARAVAERLRKEPDHPALVAAKKELPVTAPARAFDIAASLLVDTLLVRAERLRAEAAEARAVARDAEAVAAWAGRRRIAGEARRLAREMGDLAELAEAAAAALEAAAARLVPDTK